MKLNNLDDFTKNNWYITTTASTTDTTRQIKQESPSSSSTPSAAIQQNFVAAAQQQQQQRQIVTNIDNKIINIKNQFEEENINNEKYLINQLNIMPATTTTIDTKQTTTSTSTPSSDILAVEELVYEIKENLRLKARPSSQQNGIGGRSSSRPSPYHIPCRSWNDQQQQQQQQQHTTTTDNQHCNYINSYSKINQHHHHYYHHHHHHKKEQDIDDPYELLQTLLKSKNLVKEAVRRLQLNTISNKKHKTYFYDSDDESRSPMFRMCQLEL